ncbi:MAG: hypothetical protein ABI642_15745 [Polaromonas sp.]
MTSKATFNDAKNPAQAPPVTEPTARPGSLEKGQDETHDEDSADGLANREMDEQTTLARPPLGN